MSDIEYERLKEAAEREYRLNLEAIERIRHMEHALAKSTPSLPTNGKPKNHATPHEPKKAPPQINKGGKVISAVRKVIVNLDGKFTRNTVQAALEASHPGLDIKTGSLKAVLKRMVETGEIKVLTPAQGRTGATYQRGKIVGAN